MIVPSTQLPYLGSYRFARLAYFARLRAFERSTKVPAAFSRKGKGHLTSRMADLNLPFKPTCTTCGQSLEPETERSTVQSMGDGSREVGSLEMVGESADNGVVAGGHQSIRG